ncbi:MAG: transcriptional repressor [Actinomycetota bacterium]|nr:transcriptional repressor [Actinomycetota bacterium]
MSDERVEAAMERVRAGGGRATVDRRAVLEALVRTAHHATAEEIAGLVQAEHPDCNLATVYRALELFERLGIVSHVHLGHGPSQWHLAELAHHHLVCDSCGAVVEVGDDVFDPLRQRILADTGFVLDPHHFSLSGQCARCAAATPPAAGQTPIGS